jgi:hypothetical protein
VDRLPEWVTAIATAITATGVLTLRKQILMLRQQMTADHERSRRENAINYLFEWSRGLSQVSSLARRLAESLNDDQTRNLAGERPMRLSIDKRNLVLGCLSHVPEGGLKESNNEILLDEREVAEIRWQLVRYLNILESIFVAARHNVADKDILLEQFGYLVSSRQGHHLLKRFRDAVGGESYPALSELEKTLEERHSRSQPGKPKIV